MNFFEKAANQMEKTYERNMKNVRSKVKTMLRSKSDDEVRNLIYNGKEEVKDLARDEANRRGISY